MCRYYRLRASAIIRAASDVVCVRCVLMVNRSLSMWTARFTVSPIITGNCHVFTGLCHCTGCQCVNSFSVLDLNCILYSASEVLHIKRYINVLTYLLGSSLIDVATFVGVNVKQVYTLRCSVFSN